MPKDTPVANIAWANATKVEARKTAFLIRCNHCSHEFIGNASRVLSHLIGDGNGVKPCDSCPDSVQLSASALKAEKAAKESTKRKQRDEVEAIQQKKKAKESPAGPGPSAIGAGSSYGSSSNPNANRSSPIVHAMRLAAVKQANTAVANIFFAEGIPMVKIRSVFFKKMISAVAAAGSGYVPPGYNPLRTTLLDEAKRSTNEELSRVFDKRIAQTKCTITSDGWSDPAKHPLLNILAVCCAGAKFLDSVNTEGEVKTGLYIATKLMEAIEAVGAANVVQVVTDGAANCVAACKIIQDNCCCCRYPHIIFTVCTAHAIDLALEDIFKLQPFSELLGKARRVITFINNHQAALAAYRSLEDGVLMLLKPGETRFATSHIMLQRGFQQSNHLQKLAVSAEWQAMVGKLSIDKKREAAEVKLIILDDDFWLQAKQALDVTEPLVRLLRLADGTAPCTGKIYFRMSQCLKVCSKHGLPEDVQAEMELIISERWSYLHSPIHGAAYCLDPEFWDDAGENEECKRDLLLVINMLLPTPEERHQARQQFAAYKAKEGLFTVAGAAVEDASSMPAHQWWDMYGSGCKELQSVAIAILSQVSAAVACERNWSTYNYIHNKKRNKLTPARARDLVHVFSNQRLLQQLNSGAHEEKFVGWDSESEQEEVEGGVEGESEEQE